MDVHCSVGTNTGNDFFDFIRGSVIPNMLPYPNSKSILVVDNCSIHHVDYVTDMIRDSGVLLLFLPPYSNPVEPIFGFVKGYLKKQCELSSIVMI